MSHYFLCSQNKHSKNRRFFQCVVSDFVAAGFFRRNDRSGGAAEGGCGGNSAASEPKRSPAALLVQSRPTKKSFVHNFLFAPARFFLLKGKQNFSLAVCSLRAGRRGFASARARRNSPHTPLPPRPRFERRRNLCQLKTGAPHLFFNFQKQ